MSGIKLRPGEGNFTLQATLDLSSFLLFFLEFRGVYRYCDEKSGFVSISISIEICENLRNDLSNPDGDNETGGGRGGGGGYGMLKEMLGTVIYLIYGNIQIFNCNH